MVRNYIIIAIRNLWKNRTISAINVFGLGVSMSVCLMLIIIIMDQLSYDSFHKDEDRIYRVITDRVNKQDGDIWSTATTAYPLAQQMLDHTSVESLSTIKNGFSGVILKGDLEVSFGGLYSDEQFFDVFNFPLKHGDAKTALSLPNSIVLTKELAAKLFEIENPINEIIEVEGLGDFVVTGITDQLPGKTQIVFEALASVKSLPILKKESKLTSSLNDWRAVYNSYIYYRIKQGSSPTDLEELFAKASADNYTEEDHQCVFKSQSLNSIVMGPELSNAIGFTLPAVMIYFLAALALIVLVLACLNYANLTTARALSRAKEIGIRKTVGARRAQIFTQFVIEAVIISMVAFVFADLISQFLHPRFNNFLGSQGAPISFDAVPYLYAIFLLFGIATGLIAGFFPAVVLSSTKPLSALRKSLSLGQLSNKLRIRGLSLRKALIVLQFAFTIFFVITIMVVNQQMDFVMSKDHGFKVEGIVNVPLNGIDYKLIKNEFEKLSVVKHISATTHYPARGTNYNVQAFSEDSNAPLNLDYFGVDEDYVISMDLNLIAGHNFPENTSGRESFIIINETAVRQLGYESPSEALNHVIRIDSAELAISGVVQDYNYQRLDKPIDAMALRYLPHAVGHLVVSISAENDQDAMSQMNETWKGISNRPFEGTFFKDDMRLSYGHFEAIMVIVGYVTIIIVSLACLGLLGMVMFHIQYRTKEIGIRKTLGATHGNILVIVGKNFFVLIVIAYFIGGPLAYFVNDGWLSTYAYRINIGIGMLLSGLLMVLTVVGLTIGSQLYRAMNLNPVDSLKDE